MKVARMAALALAALGCGQAPSKPPVVSESTVSPWFADATQESGLDFVHDAGPRDGHPMPQIMGSGVALFDFDGDGLLDIYLLQNAGPKSQAKNRLYRQATPGHFEDVSKGSGLDFADFCMGVAIGDINNDGKPDVAVTTYGGGVRLFLNLGKGVFRDITQQAGIDSTAWGTSACFADFDRDGWLDLLIVNYLDYNPATRCSGAAGARDYCAPAAFQGTASRLFRNRGKGTGDVFFEDVSISSGIGKLPGPGLGVIAADFDGDGWVDFFIANDGKANRLWINRHDGTFEDQAVRRNIALDGMGKAQAGMGVGLADGDGDGLLDLVVTHLVRETHTVWKQGPRGMFNDRTAHAGLTRAAWSATGFGTAFVDFDDDGAPDLAVVAGGVLRGTRADNAEIEPFWRDYAERNQLFANDGQGRFRDISAGNPPLCGKPRVGRGLACGDLFGTGAIDLVVTEIAGPARIYRNVVPTRGHWLNVRAFDPGLHRDAYGAEVTVVAGTRRRVGLITASGSYCSANEPIAHFGLGDLDSYEALEVSWPDGSKEVFPGGAANRRVELRRGEGKAQKAMLP